MGKRGLRKVGDRPRYASAVAVHLRQHTFSLRGSLSVRGDVSTPFLVESLAQKRVRVAKVACGNSHAALCTEIDDVYTGAAHSRLLTHEGGHVYICGASTALGESIKEWRLVEELVHVRVRDIAAGYVV